MVLAMELQMPLMPVGCKMPTGASQTIPTLSQQLIFRAVYFDGQTAAAQIATASLGTDTLRLHNAESEVLDQFDRADLYRSATTPEQLVMAVGGDHDARQIVVERAELPPAVWTSLQRLPDRPHTSLRPPLRFMLACLAFIIACLAIFTILIPAAADRLAPIIPRSFEQTLGDRLERIVLQVGQHNICGSSADDDHLSALAGQLQTASEATIPVSIHIIDLPNANAFALPSGRIYVMRSLLDLTQTPDELIAILAHEMGHVQAHHALRLSLRVGGSSAALGFLLGDFTGSAAVFAIGQTLIGTAFSREFEREADELSVPIMQNMGISPQILADMLARLEGADVSAGILATHPVTSERLNILQQAGANLDRSTPSGEFQNLSSQGWKTLKLICD